MKYKNIFINNSSSEKMASRRNTKTTQMTVAESSWIDIEAGKEATSVE